MFLTGEPATESLKILEAGWNRKHKVETVRGQETVRLRVTEEPQRIGAAIGKTRDDPGGMTKKPRETEF